MRGWEACGVPEQCPEQSDLELWGTVSWGTESRSLYSVFRCKLEHCSKCRAGLLLNGIHSETMVTTIELFEMCHFRGLEEIPVGLLGSAGTTTKEFPLGWALVLFTLQQMANSNFSNYNIQIFTLNITGVFNQNLYTDCTFKVTITSPAGWSWMMSLLNSKRL